jgi:hypothetical protein
MITHSMYEMTRRAWRSGRFMLLIIAVISSALIAVGGGRWKLHPALAAAVEQIKIGELTSIRGTDPVIGAMDEQAREEYLKAQKANDKEGIDELKAAGKIGVIPPGVDLRVLERNEGRLDSMMDTVHKLLDIDINVYKQCLGRNIRRTQAGLRLEACSFDFNEAYDLHTGHCLDGRTPVEFIDSNVLVLVRVLNRKESSQKFWVPYSSLMRPSRSVLP